MYRVAWDHLESGQVQKSQLRIASRELAESTAKTLNRVRPEVEHWVEDAEDAGMARFDTQQDRSMPE